MFKDIPGYEGLYQIDEDGNVINIRTGKQISYYISNKGYKIVDLNKNGVRTHLLVHRLVAMTFIPNPNNYPIILHKDNIKTNTNVSNLEWGTYSENNSQAIRDGLNTVPRPDNRKHYSIYDKETGKGVKTCYGLNDIIDKIGYGNESIIRNTIFRQQPIRSGVYKDLFIKRVELRSPFIFSE